MLKKGKFITFIAIVTIVICLCLPVLNRAEDDEKPPDDEPRPTLAGTVKY